MEVTTRNFLEQFFAGARHKIELRTFAPNTNGKRGGIRDRIFSRDARTRYSRS
jgi:hypothetical protein